MPSVKPLKSDSGPTVRQPKAPFRALPANSLHIGPSGSGKSLALLRTLMDSDKLGGMFDRYEIFSPNIFIDPQYKALIKYIEGQTNQKRDDFCHEEFDQEAIRKLMDEQKKSNAWLRKQGAKRLLSACVVIDDFGERADIVKAHGSTLNSLFTRGRHLQISCYGLLLQRFRMANPTIRFNAHVLYVHELNNTKDLEALSEEFGQATGGVDNFIEMYKRATAKRYGFLFIVTGAEPRFYSSYDTELKVKHQEEEEGGMGAGKIVIIFLAWGHCWGYSKFEFPGS